MLLVTGYRIPFINQKRITRMTAWAMAIVTVFFSIWVSMELEPLMRMLVIVVLQLVTMKILVLAETYSHENRLTFIQWTAFCLGWFGMRPIPFEKLPHRALPSEAIFRKGVTRIVAGIALLYLSLVVEIHSETENIFLPQLFLLAGLSLILHFGILNLSTVMWRRFGVNVSELFKAPYKSTSLKEFWGKRWNIAFSEMTASIVYRPLKTRVGKEKALITSFLFSGLLHEAAISLPVMAGAGLPMIYFLIQAFAMHLESHTALVQRIIRHKWLAHIWVMGLLIAPLPLLFHHHFINEVLIPLRDLILDSLQLI